MEVIGKFKEFGHEFDIYGTVENPLFLATEIASLIDYSVGKTHQMLKCVDESEKILIKICDRYNVSTTSRARHTQEKWFLTEYGLYEVLFQSRKPIAKGFKTKVKQILKDLRLHGKVEREFDFDNMFIPYDLKEDFESHNAIREDHGHTTWTFEEYLDKVGMMVDSETKRIIPNK